MKKPNHREPDQIANRDDADAERERRQSSPLRVVAQEMTTLGMGVAADADRAVIADATPAPDATPALDATIESPTIPEVASASDVVAPSPAPPIASPPIAATSASAPPVAPAFRIVEALGWRRGKAWTVTNGVVSRACPSRAYAEIVVAELARRGLR